MQNYPETPFCHFGIKGICCEVCIGWGSPPTSPLRATCSALNPVSSVKTSSDNKITAIIFASESTMMLSPTYCKARTYPTLQISILVMAFITPDGSDNHCRARSDLAKIQVFNKCIRALVLSVAFGIFAHSHEKCLSIFTSLTGVFAAIAHANSLHRTFGTSELRKKFLVPFAMAVLLVAKPGREGLEHGCL